MLNIIGYIIVIGSVFGGFYIAKGPMHMLFQPVEFLIILGCAFGAFLVANPLNLVIDTFKSIIPFYTGGKFKKDFYTEALMLMHDLLHVNKVGGAVELEKHLEEPEESHVFQRYPLILKDHHTTEFVCDNMRLVTLNKFEPHVIEKYIEDEIDQYYKHAKEPGHALQAVSDALPGLGIVAAVLGIIITMQHLDGSNAEIGHHIGVALVGTFAGLLFSYGFVGPAASALDHIAEDEKRLFQVLKVFVVAILHQYPAEVAAEISRKFMPPHCKPDFAELEEKISESKAYFKKNKG
ncbi:flagellar motor stator protein MotA [Alteromonas macleodii]|uniref:flagellar motor stator protein MotA n=1 Tax=Alteromonas macleodii TaxID=28108 RepID=UPI00314062EF